MQPDAHARFGLTPPLRRGERVGMLFRDDDGARTEMLGYVTVLEADELAVIDRHGRERHLGWDAVEALRRVPVSRGRRPGSASRDLLDALAERAGAGGVAWVARISDLLAQEPPPEQVPAWGTTAVFGSSTAQHEGEWVTLAGGSAADWVAAAWWATRMGARSVQVRVRADDHTPGASGFIRLG